MKEYSEPECTLLQDQGCPFRCMHGDDLRKDLEKQNAPSAECTGLKTLVRDRREENSFGTQNQ